MAKQLTQWRRQGRTQPTINYDSSSIDYDSSTTKYADNGETHDSVIKARTSWTKHVKQTTRFIHNPDALTNDALFDTHRQYNVAATYDGIVVGEPHSTAKKAMIWRRA